MPGLDGLRAISVIAVIVYHLNDRWAPGGFLGVGIFFVLSGYLITDQLIGEWNRERRINLIRFWIRRARRLLPALFVMLAAVVVWLILFDPARLQSLRGDIISAVFYVNNWWLIFHEVSYFESFGPPSPIGHLWSLAIEEQFYMLWPLVLVIGLWLSPKRLRLILLTMTGVVASLLAMIWLFEPGMDPSRVYYGTDTRAFALLIGAALAIIVPSESMNEKLSNRMRNVLDIAGGIGLILMIVLIMRTDEYGEFLYYAGLLLLSIFSAIVIAVLAHPASRLARVMGCLPMRWIGLRSYSLYLWHYPVIILSGSAFSNGEFDLVHLIYQLVVTLLLSAISWRYIEEPIRRGLIGRLWRRLRSHKTLLVYVRSVLVIVSILILMTMSFTTKVDRLTASQLTHQYSDRASELYPDPKTLTTHTRTDVASELPPLDSPTGTASETNAPSDSILSVPPLLESETGLGITAIGDSVILDAKPYLEKMLPGIVVDGKVGRQMKQAQEVVDQLKADGQLGDRIIIELGTNGPFNTKQLRELLISLEETQQIVLVNTRVPRNWQDTVNAALEEVATDFLNTMIVDWYTASEGKTAYFSKDGVHLTPEGAEIYAALVVDAIQTKVVVNIERSNNYR